MTLTESLVSLSKQHMVFTVSEQVSMLRSRAPPRAVMSTTTLLFFASFIENVGNTRPVASLAMISGLVSSGVLHASALTLSAPQTLSAGSSSSAAKSCLPPASVVEEFRPVAADCWRMRVAQQNPAPAPEKPLLTAGTSCFSETAAANSDTARCYACSKSLCVAFDRHAPHAPGALAESSLNIAIHSAATITVVRQHSHWRARQGGVSVATNPAPHALRFCAYPRALLSSRVLCAGPGSAAARRLAFVPEANISCAADFFWRRRHLAGMLSRRARARGGGLACWRGRNCSACHWRSCVLRGLEEPLPAVGRRKQEAEVAFYQLWAALAPNTSRKDSSKDIVREAHDTTTAQTPSDAASDVSLQTRGARGSRSYRVIALFRSDLSLEKVRESVGTYVLQLRKWRCARPRALYRGHRRLAYLIKGQESAHIVELTFDIFPSAVRYFRMKLDVDPTVLRFMILKNPPLPRSIIRRQHLIPPEEFGELVKYSGSFTT